MAKQAHFGPEVYQFLDALKRNNEREWFKSHKNDYENFVKIPMQKFIVDIGPKLEKISAYIKADPRPVGGSLFRIYRDTRFSADKTPYKTHVAAHFRHQAGKDAHAPGFYMHLEPAKVLVAGGVWTPDSGALKRIRTRISEDRDNWKKVKRSKCFQNGWSFGGESLKRAPRGFDPEDPFVDDLKRKSFMLRKELPASLALQANFDQEVAKAFRQIQSLCAFVSGALELPW